MKKALVSTKEPIDTGFRVVEVVDAGREFEVHSSFIWVDCPDTVFADDIYDLGTATFSKRQIEVAPLASQARDLRDVLLQTSDFSQLPDVQAQMTPELRAAWVEYRQLLRDITAQPGFPLEIVWPEKPV